MRILVDMNLTHRWASHLNDAGHEAVHWSAVGAARAKDTEICDYAREHAFVLLTNDLDFPRILAHTRQAAPSVVLVRGEPLVPEVRGEALLSALRDCEAELSLGAIVTLDWFDRPRARVLPLR
jgi:predicted nuclease of predicted toxin-antitoxin system